MSAYQLFTGGIAWFALFNSFYAIRLARRAISNRSQGGDK